MSTLKNKPVAPSTVNTAATTKKNRSGNSQVCSGDLEFLALVCHQFADVIDRRKKSRWVRTIFNYFCRQKSNTEDNFVTETFDLIF